MDTKLTTVPIMPSKGSLPHPMEIPIDVAKLAHRTYVDRYGGWLSLKEIAEQGGFETSEMDDYLPDWRGRCCPDSGN